MITAIKADPGGGKSYLLVRLAVDRLLHSTNMVWTNEKILFGHLREYVVKLGFEGDLDERLRLMTHDQVFEFYRYRSGGLVLPPSPDFDAEDDGRMNRQDFNARMFQNFALIKSAAPECQLPCTYLISETQDFFGARDWAKNGRGTLFYAGKHRHLRDETFYTAHQLDFIEKQFRGLTSETWHITNQMRRSISIFRMRPCFKVRKYYGIPGPNQMPYGIETVFLEPDGIGACYKTTGALSVNSKPEAVKNPGWLPWWMMIVAGVAAVLAVICFLTLLPMWGGKTAEKMLMGSVGTKTAKALGAPSAETPRAVAAPNNFSAGSSQPGDRPVQSQNQARASEQFLEQKPVYVAGVIRDRTRCTVRLTDGTLFTEEDSAIFVRRSSVEVNGRSYAFAPISPGTPARRGADGNTVVVTAPGPAKVVSSPAESERATSAAIATETPPSESPWPPEVSSPSPTPQKFGANQSRGAPTGARVWADARPTSQRQTQKR